VTQSTAPDDCDGMLGARCRSVDRGGTQVVDRTRWKVWQACDATLAGDAWLSSEAESEHQRSRAANRGRAQSFEASQCVLVDNDRSKAGRHLVPAGVVQRNVARSSAALAWGLGVARGDVKAGVSSEDRCHQSCDARGRKGGTRSHPCCDNAGEHARGSVGAPTQPCASGSWCAWCVAPASFCGDRRERLS